MFLDNNSAAGSNKARTHWPGWRTAHASSIDEKGLLIILIKSKATSAPPRAGTTGTLYARMVPPANRACLSISGPNLKAIIFSQTIAGLKHRPFPPEKHPQPRSDLCMF